MNEDVKRCVDARVNFFDEYYVVPDEIEGEVSAFIRGVIELGESCNDANTFEKEFVSTGLSERFTTVLPKCTPKPAKMTKEQKQQSRRIAREIIADNKNEIIKDAVKDAGSKIFNEIKDDEITKNRERMIENGTFDDFARESNKADSVRTLFGALRNRKKK